MIDSTYSDWSPSRSLPFIRFYSLNANFVLASRLRDPSLPGPNVLQCTRRAYCLTLYLSGRPLAYCVCVRVFSWWVGWHLVSQRQMRGASRSVTCVWMVYTVFGGEFVIEGNF